MEKNIKIIRSLSDLNFYGVDHNNSYLTDSDIYTCKLVTNSFSKDAILLANDKSLIFNNYMFIVTKYDVDDLTRRYNINSLKITSITNNTTGRYQTEVKKIYDLFLYAGLFNEAYLKYPEGWLNEDQMVEWLEKRKLLNIPNELIKIKYNIEPIEGGDYREYIGNYKVNDGKTDYFFTMKYELGYSGIHSKYGVGDQIIIDTPPIMRYMIGWTKQRLLEYCTLNNCTVERIKIIEHMPYHGD